MSTYLRPPDLLANISLLSTEQGGRVGPAKSGYRPSHDFGLEGTFNDAAHEYLGRDWLAPGESCAAHVYLFVPEAQVGRLYEGFQFAVHEGRKVVGMGVVLKVLNAALRRDA